MGSMGYVAQLQVIGKSALALQHDGLMPWRIVVRCNKSGPLQSGATE